jgi:AmmeMemoRadiSam system protein B
MEKNVRRASFAGSWYPAGTEDCEQEIQAFLEDEKPRVPPGDSLVGGIVPHAGWYFSGKIACNVIAALREETPQDVILIFGMHLHPGSPAFIMTDGVWETPFGRIRIQAEVARKLAANFDFMVETADSHNRDNTIELQLPFINYFFPGAQIVPMGVPPASASLKIGRAAADYARQLGLNVKVVGSTDLTHYGLNYGFTGHGSGASAVKWVREKNDRRVIEAMLNMEPETVIEEALANQNACCAGAAATAIAASRQLGAVKAHQLAYATSYDKHPGDSFVGYVGIVFEK